MGMAQQDQRYSAGKGGCRLCMAPGRSPPALLAAVFIGGYLWAWMTIRYQSLWPAWLSHTVADTISDAIFKA